MRNNPYDKTTWVDNIIDPIDNQVIQEGTRFTAGRANNIEDGIYNSYERIISNSGDILRLKVQMELDGRVPGSLGSFYDSLVDLEPSRMIRQVAEAILLEPSSKGAKTLHVDNIDGFEELAEVTIFDDEHSEDVLVTSVDGLTISVQELQNGYKKGAIIARSSAYIDDGNLGVGSWITLNMEEV